MQALFHNFLKKFSGKGLGLVLGWIGISAGGDLSPYAEGGSEAPCATCPARVTGPCATCPARVTGPCATCPAQVTGPCATCLPQAQKNHLPKQMVFCVGENLFSRAVTSQVSSAPASLTSVFGMGTGGPSRQSTPTCVFCLSRQLNYNTILFSEMQALFQNFLKKFSGKGLGWILSQRVINAGCDLSPYAEGGSEAPCATCPARVTGPCATCPAQVTGPEKTTHPKSYKRGPRSGPFHRVRERISLRGTSSPGHWVKEINASGESQARATIWPL